MLQNLDTVLSIVVSVLSIIGFIVMIFRRKQKPDVQQIIYTPSRVQPAKRGGRLKTLFLLLLVGSAGYATWRVIFSPEFRFSRDSRSTFERRTYDSRTRINPDRFPHRTNDYRR